MPPIDHSLQSKRPFQLCDDLVLYHGWHSWRQEAARQEVLSPLVQPRRAPRGVPAVGRFLDGAFLEDALYGEDIDFSLRIYKNGYSCRLFPEAWLWHKRRTDFRKFWRQVYNSGYARINLWRKYPEALKPVHALPAVFTIGVAGLLLFSVFSVLALIPLILYSALIFIDSTIRNKSVMVGLKSIPAAFIQLIGYGVGFLESLFTKKHG